MEEQQETQAAPEQVTEQSSAPVEQAASVSSPTNEVAKETADNQPAGEQTGQNWEQEYKRIQAEKQQLESLYRKREQSYNELRKKLPAVGAEKNAATKELQELRKQFSEMQDVFRKQFAPKHDPAKFSEELVAKGPDYILDLVKQHRDSLIGEERSTVQQLSDTVTQMRTERAVERRALNSAEYPNFKELESTMTELYNTNRDFFDGQYQDVEDKLDALYTAAKLQHSQDAIEEAGKRGLAKANQQLAQEANSAVAGGGRATKAVPRDVKNLSSDEIAKLIKEQGQYEVE